MSDLSKRIQELADEIDQFKERYVTINVSNTPINQYVKQKLDEFNLAYVNAQHSPD